MWVMTFMCIWYLKQHVKWLDKSTYKSGQIHTQVIRKSYFPIWPEISRVEVTTQKSDQINP